MSNNKKDHELVNFREDYELNYELKKGGFRQTEKNRDLVRNLGVEAKNSLGKRTLTHAELEMEITKNKSKFDK